MLHVSLLCISIGVAGFFAGRLGSRPDDLAGAPNGGAENSAARRNGSTSERGQAAARGPSGASTAQGKAAIRASAKATLGQALDQIRLERWIQLLGKMHPEDAVSIAELLAAERVDGRDYPTATMLFWQNWARVDPQGALAYLHEHPEDNASGGMEQLMKGWAFFDPAAAMEAFSNLGDSPLTGAALAGLASGMARSDPTAAVDFATGLPAQFEAKAAGLVSQSVIKESGVEEARAWFDALPAKSPIFQKEAVRVLLENMTHRSEPGAVEKFAMERLDQGWSSRPSEQNFAASMILRNGGSPWDYVSTIMEKYPNTENPLAIAKWVSVLDADSAVIWVDAHPDHQNADKILAGAAQALLQKGKQAEAEALLARIKQAEIRDMVGQQ
jgi:hypothetical protein